MRLSVKLNFSEDFEKSALNENTYVGALMHQRCPIMFIDGLKEK